MGGRIDVAQLAAFERGLDPRTPEHGAIPARVLGYGEISTVLAIDAIDPAAVFKRMPMFRTTAEITAYIALYERGMALMRDEIGLDTADGQLVAVGENGDPYLTLYMVQEKLASHAIVSNALRVLPDEEIDRLITAVFHQIARVFDFNQANAGRLEVALDAQLSNWAIRGFDHGRGLPDRIELAYVDTNTPLLRDHGVEQFDPELFLRSTPGFMLWLVRAFFLEDVMTRYYDVRKVLIDLVANLHKEQRPDLIPRLLERANAFLVERGVASPITRREIDRYYRDDAFTWRLYLTLRRLDRRLQTAVGRPYPYTLPEHVQR